MGLAETDTDLFWIARQALDTPIPAPWTECLSGDGEVFYYNTETKESAWDHPYDGFYKAAILRFKSGECSKSELVDSVSQPWLLAGSERRSSVGSTDEMMTQLSKVRSTIGIEPPDSLNYSLSVMSPTRGGRRRLTANSAVRTGSEATEIEVLQLRHHVDELTEKNTSLTAELQQMKADLLKARDYIELLLVENKGLKTRMTDATHRVVQMKSDGVSLRDQLSIEVRKRETAERRILVLEDKIRALEIASPTRSSVPLFSRLCGSSIDSVPARPVVGRARSGPNSGMGTPKPSRPSSPQNPDPYKELLALLTVSSPPPAARPVK